MERLEFKFSGSHELTAKNKQIISGVLGSGNLEVLVEAASGSVCTVEIDTAAVGFGKIWEAVIGDVMQRWDIGGIRISINDAGATPAVVALRLEQALKSYVADEDTSR